MSLYPQNRNVQLRERLFTKPTAEYRGTPFWSWNNRLQRDQLLRQITQFHQMGFGGFHMHARTGLNTPYMGKDFLAMVRACTKAAAKHKMLAWLYDEDRWPSGFAGGLVTKDPQHRMKYILFTHTPYNGTVRPTPNWSHARVGRLETGTLLARYTVKLRGGCLADYRRLAVGERMPKGTTEWFAYLETAGGVPWYNHQGYVDALSPAATRRFIEVTHERYKSAVGEYFGNVVPAIFTDEPQHVFKDCFDHPAHNVDLTVPATADFFDTYQTAYGHDLLDALPEIFWNLPDSRASAARYRYHDHVTERFAQAFAGTLGRWCEANGILLTGHMMEESTLFSQTRAIGEAMRSLAHFQLPGIDMLCDRIEFTTAKQAQSVAHQYGRPGVMSELYGVTGWDYDFVGHKAQGDWQAALGVTVRVPHLSWVSMAGEAKRDYPASIHYQAPWWKEYQLIEDHFARVNVVLSRGTAVVRVAVIHPIESYWLCFGPVSQTKAERELRDRQFLELPQWLLGGLIDFDYVSEALLPTQTAGASRRRKFVVGDMAYDVVVVPAMRTIRTTTLARLEQFAAAGGRVIFAGEVPSLADACLSSRATRLASRTSSCAWDRQELLVALEPYRDINCCDTAGIRNEELIYQMRSDGSERHLFLCHRNRQRAADNLQLHLRGSWRVFTRHTISGAVSELYATPNNRDTMVPLDLAAHGHILLTLRPGVPTVKRRPARVSWHDVAQLADPVPITLSEPNVLLLNQAEWRWNDGAWSAREEVLRLNNRIRERCGLPPREGHIAQPWTDNAPVDVLGRVSLRFRFLSEVAIAAPELALEDAGSWNIMLDGRLISATARGWWTDEAISRIALPWLTRGKHELVVSRLFTRKTELEWCYLLGDFGVAVSGRHAKLTAPIRTLAFGDWTRQGLPFYAGNVTYHCKIQPQKAEALAVSFPRFKAPLLVASLDGRKPTCVAFAPFRLELGKIDSNSCNLNITAFGNRHNAFGPVHNIDPHLLWIGPNSWRSTGEQWAYEYQLKPMGLLVAPRLQTRELLADIEEDCIARRKRAAPFRLNAY